jgi:adenylate kinase
MDECQTRLRAWLGSGSLNLFGLPFAGKDTQGAILADYFGAQLVSSGQVLRGCGDTEIARIMASGDIIPPELFGRVMVPYLLSNTPAGTPLILSEVGRLPGEEVVVLEAAEKAGHPIKAAIILEMPDQEVWNRFIASQVSGDRGQRADDNKDVLQNRLEKFHNKVTPVLDFYDRRGLLLRIDGRQSRSAVSEAIFAALDSRQAR